MTLKLTLEILDAWEKLSKPQQRKALAQVKEIVSRSKDAKGKPRKKRKAVS